MTSDRHSGSSPNLKGRRQGAAGQLEGHYFWWVGPGAGPGSDSGAGGLRLQQRGLVSAGQLACARSGVGVAPEAREWEVFIFISAHHVLCFFLLGWERRTPSGDAPL